MSTAVCSVQCKVVILLLLLLLCRSCKCTWLDSSFLELLPKGIQGLFPVELTERSGLGVEWEHQLVTQAPLGVSFNTNVKTYNSLLLGKEYQRALSYYEGLNERLSAGQQLIDQVRGALCCACDAQRHGSVQVWM